MNVDEIRARFPALAREMNGRPVVYFDGPAGSQVPTSVVDAVRHYMLHENANTHGPFITADETDARLDMAHRAAADLFGAEDPDCVHFGPNMTTLTFALSRAMAKTWAPGDEIIVTQLDHDANVRPWMLAAEDAGATVKHLSINQEDCTLDLGDLERKLSPRTRLVAIGAASNAVGTVNPVREIADLVHMGGAHLFVDAVHYAPHLLMDVVAWDADFVACSAYKFFGPHVGMLWGRRHLLESLPAYRVRPAGDALPGRWMTGTQSHEGLAGTIAAIDYLAGLGEGDTRRQRLVSGFGNIRDHEAALTERMLEGLLSHPQVTLYGKKQVEGRVPTFGITHAKLSPAALAQHLGERGIFVWEGNFYALPLTTALGLEPDGMVRIGLLHYARADEVDRLLAEIPAG